MACKYISTYNRPNTDVEFFPPDMPLEASHAFRVEFGITVEKTYSEDQLQLIVEFTFPTKNIYLDWKNEMGPRWLACNFLDWLYDNNIAATHETIENT